ncbi:MAG: glycosyltransferase [Nitrospirae bacterium]|nr:glycosyltransferase [Nitrospirota bacterium]
MNILFVIPAMAHGGAESFVRDLSLFFLHRGHSVQIVSGGGALLRHLDNRITTITLPYMSRTPLSLLIWVLRLKKIISSSNVDIVCCQSILTAMAVSVALCGNRTIAHVLILHNPLRHWYFHILGLFANSSLDKIISVGRQNQRTLYALGVRKDMVVHIPVAINIEHFRYKDNTMDLAGPVVTVVARMERYKGHHYLIDAIEELKRLEGIRLSVNFCGEGSYADEVKSYVSDKGLTTEITFKGTCTDVASVLAQSDIFILPSYVEAFPISILEAMSSGVAVVATSVGDVPSIVINGETGLLVPPRNSQALKNAILEILRNKTLYEKVRKAARSMIEEGFSVESVGLKYEKEFLSLLCSQGDMSPTAKAGGFSGNA